MMSKTPLNRRIVKKNSNRKQLEFGYQWQKRIWSIRNVTTGCFLTSLVLLGSIMIFICLVFASRSVNNVTVNSSLLVKTIVENFVREWLGQAPGAISGVEKYFLFTEAERDLSFRDPSDRDHINLYIHMLISQYDDLYISYGSTTGIQLGAYPVCDLYNGDPCVAWTNEQSMEMDCSLYNETNQPDPVYLAPVFTNGSVGSVGVYEKYGNYPFDYRCIKGGWYTNAMALYNETYTFTTHMHRGGRIQLSLSKKMFDSTGALRGVIMCGFSLYEFQNFISDLLTDKLILGQSQMFVVETSGELLANSLNQPLFRETKETQTITQVTERVKAEDSENEVIRSAARRILSEFRSWDRVQTTTGRFLNENNQLISVIAPKPQDSLQVVFVHIMKSSVIYREVILAGVISSAVLLVVSCTFVIISVIVIVCITKPLGQLVVEMKKIEEMKLEDINLNISSLFEVNQLQDAFVFAVSKLREYRSFLPLNLVRDGEDDIDEDFDCQEDDANDNEPADIVNKAPEELMKRRGSVEPSPFDTPKKKRKGSTSSPVISSSPGSVASDLSISFGSSSSDDTASINSCASTSSILDDDSSSVKFSRCVKIRSVVNVHVKINESVFVNGSVYSGGFFSYLPPEDQDQDPSKSFCEFFGKQNNNINFLKFHSKVVELLEESIDGSSGGMLLDFTHDTFNIRFGFQSKTNPSYIRLYTRAFDFCIKFTNKANLLIADGNPNSTGGEPPLFDILVAGNAKAVKATVGSRWRKSKVCFSEEINKASSVLEYIHQSPIYAHEPTTVNGEEDSEEENAEGLLKCKGPARTFWILQEFEIVRLAEDFLFIPCEILLINGELSVIYKFLGRAPSPSDGEWMYVLKNDIERSRFWKVHQFVTGCLANIKAGRSYPGLKNFAIEKNVPKFMEFISEYVRLFVEKECTIGSKQSGWLDHRDEKLFGESTRKFISLLLALTVEEKSNKIFDLRYATLKFANIDTAKSFLKTLIENEVVVVEDEEEVQTTKSLMEVIRSAQKTLLLVE